MLQSPHLAPACSSMSMTFLYWGTNTSQSSPDNALTITEQWGRIINVQHALGSAQSYLLMHKDTLLTSVQSPGYFQQSYPLDRHPVTCYFGLAQLTHKTWHSYIYIYILPSSAPSQPTFPSWEFPAQNLFQCYVISEMKMRIPFSAVETLPSSWAISPKPASSSYFLGKS